MDARTSRKPPIPSKSPSGKKQDSNSDTDSNSPSRPKHWAESAKVSVLIKRITELEDETAAQAIRIKTFNLDKARYVILSLHHLSI